MHQQPAVFQESFKAQYYFYTAREEQEQIHTQIYTYIVREKQPLRCSDLPQYTQSPNAAATASSPAGEGELQGTSVSLIETFVL